MRIIEMSSFIYALMELRAESQIKAVSLDSPKRAGLRRAPLAFGQKLIQMPESVQEEGRWLVSAGKHGLRAKASIRCGDTAGKICRAKGIGSGAVRGTSPSMLQEKALRYLWRVALLHRLWH